jgi:hypothetical protein
MPVKSSSLIASITPRKNPSRVAKEFNIYDEVTDESDTSEEELLFINEINVGPEFQVSIIPEVQPEFVPNEHLIGGKFEIKDVNPLQFFSESRIASRAKWLIGLAPVQKDARSTRPRRERIQSSSKLARVHGRMLEGVFDIRFAGSTTMFQVKWLGDSDTTWEPESCFDSDPVLASIIKTYKKEKQDFIRREKRRERDLESTNIVDQRRRRSRNSARDYIVAATSKPATDIPEGKT